jgi:hypothetical protein
MKLKSHKISVFRQTDSAPEEESYALPEENVDVIDKSRTKNGKI